LEIKGFVVQIDIQRIEAMEIPMLYQTKKTPFSLSRWLRRVALPLRARQVTDIRELSPYLRDDIGARDLHDPCFR
jgi:hypothetical protein